MQRILLANGYLEAKRKPNLFWKTVLQGSRVYAGMRSTDEVPIQEDTRPLFTWEFDQDAPMWKRRRIIKEELTRLRDAGCLCRLADEFADCEEFEETSTSIDEQLGIFDWDDGYCSFCGKDFGGEGSFCSKKCEDDFRKRSRDSF